MSYSVDPWNLAEMAAACCAALDKMPEAATAEGRKAILDDALENCPSLDSGVTEDDMRWFEGWVNGEITGEDLRALTGMGSIGRLFPFQEG